MAISPGTGGQIGLMPRRYGRRARAGHPDVCGCRHFRKIGLCFPKDGLRSVVFEAANVNRYALFMSGEQYLSLFEPPQVPQCNQIKTV